MALKANAVLAARSIRFVCIVLSLVPSQIAFLRIQGLAGQLGQISPVPRGRESLSRWNAARTGPLFRMMMSFRKPVVIAAAVAVISAAVIIIINHTDLFIDRRPPLTPPGTTFHTVKEAGAEMTPTQPEWSRFLPPVRNP